MTQVKQKFNSYIQTQDNGKFFLDEFGRVRFFHGMNSVAKGFPWYFDWMLNDTILDDMQRFGFNVVRLGSMWTGAEPEV